jgi:cyclophilin family peptidyl-prolyl cis-trans isomerase
MSKRGICGQYEPFLSLAVHFRNFQPPTLGPSDLLIHWILELGYWTFRRHLFSPPSGGCGIDCAVSIPAGGFPYSQNSSQITQPCLDWNLWAVGVSSSGRSIAIDLRPSRNSSALGTMIGVSAVSFRRLWQQWFGKTRKQCTRRERQSWRSVRFEPLEQRQLLTVGFEALPLGTSLIAPTGKDVLIPLSATNTNNTAVNYTVQTAPGSGVTATVENSGTTLRMNVTFTDSSNQSVTGDLFFRLFDTLTPNTVDQIKSFVQSGYYNGLRMPRVLNGFVAQFGSSNNTLSDPTGPAAFDDDFNSSLTFTGPGLLAMANSGPDSNGRQMFITDVDVPLAGMPQSLNFDHTILGQLVGGFGLFKRLLETPTQTSPFIPNENSGPINPVTINTFSVVTDNRHAVLRIQTDGAAAVGQRSVTIRATSQGDNVTADQSYTFNVQADGLNDEPFLPNLDEVVKTNAGLPITITGTDIDNDGITFDVVNLSGNATSSATNVTFSSSGNILTITPNAGFTGTQRLRVSARRTGSNTIDDLEDFDLQVSPTPQVSLSLQSGTGQIAENAGTSTVVATLSNSSVRDVTINLSLAGTATLNSDYSQSGLTGLSGTTASFVIPAGQTSGSFTFRSINDSIDEPNETILVNATSAANATINSAQSSASTSIADDDLGVSLSVLSTNIGENSGSAIVQVTLDQTHTAAVTIQLVTGGTASPSDFEFSPAGNTITIPAGSTIATVNLRAPDDNLSEPPETVVVSLGSVSAGSINPVASTATVNIADNDLRGGRLNVNNTSINENGGTTTVTATLSETSADTVIVTLGFTSGGNGLATTGSDYSLSATTISIPSGELTGTITINAVDDSISEGPEDIRVTFVSADRGYVATQGANSVSITVADNESAPQVSISASGTTLSEATTSSSITLIARSTIVSANDIIVPITFTGSATLGSDYSASSTSIRILAGQTSGSVVISVINDTLVEADETVVLGIGSITNGTQSGSFASTVSIISDDTPKVTMNVSPTKFDENGGKTTVSATLDQVAIQTVTIPLNIVNGTALSGSDFSASANTITIAAGQSTGSVVISGIDDNLFESDETFTVSVGTITGGTLSGSFSQTVTITSADVSLAPPNLDSSSDDGVSSTDNYTGDSTPSFTFTASSGQAVKFRVNGTEMGNATDNRDNTYSFTVPDGKLKIGENTIAVDSGTTSSTMSITYAPKLDEGYRVGGNVGGTTNVSFSFNAQNARFRSEVGVYIADDATGRIGNIRPGDEGYAKAALTNASVLFTRGVAVGANQVISLKGGQVLGFYLVQNGTSFQATRLNPTNRGAGAIGLGGPVTFFSFDEANPDGVRHVQVVGDPLSGHAEYRWEDLFGGGDMDFNDFVFSVNLAGSGVQPTMETLRVPVASTATASTTFTLRAGQQSPTTPTSFTNVGGEFGIFKITNSSGTVNNLTPGSAGWLAAALASANRTSIFGASEINGAVKSLNLSGSDQFGFYRIKGGTADQFLQQNPNNNSTGSIYALVSFDPANPDDQDHFRWFGPENVNQGISGQGAADDDIRLHIMDKLFGDESSFDDFTVSIRF